MDIDKYSQGLSNLEYYSKGFRNVLEDHMTYLRSHPDTQKREITPSEAYQFENDFYGLMNYKAVPMHFHHLVLRMNNMTNPDQMPPDLTFFLLPEMAVVSRLLSVYKTSDRITT